MRNSDYQLPITNYQLPITHYQLPITHYPLPITNYPMKNKLLHLFCAGLLAVVIVGGKPSPANVPQQKVPLQAAKITVTKTNYQGWKDSWVLSNGEVEAVIVPAIGRVMQFRFKGEENTFWENAKIAGKAPNPAAKEWENFGGDKTWPAPQSDWEKITGRGWPPPLGFDSFDSGSIQSQVKGNEVTLIYPVDPFYGIRTYRRINLDAKKAVMTISTTFEKVKGQPKDVSVWVITQLREPVAVYAALPQPSIFPEGYNKQSEELPANLKVENGIISLTRDPKKSHKIGCDASSLLWVGEKVAVRMDSPRIAGVSYPDQESSAEIFTSADPDAFIELEFLSPLKNLKVGQRMDLTTTYTLMRRKSAIADQEARMIFGR
ncbi:hypothetical protein [Tolypothrix sp. PCC 7910]|uniref:hypothetical protein n=1 Tax=Tolypothrix sp. PCC 7910 TaxID=2099387 RepID=UPI001AD708F4|nr:hypothetical protein [Tolypothrix sp. PCC 7910]